MRFAERGVLNVTSSAGTIFSDGVVLELIQSSSGTLQFLISDENAPKIVDRFTYGDVTYAPPQIHPSVRDSLLLPSGFAEVASTRRLFDEIAALISRACGGNQGIVVPLTFFVFASWLSEFAPVPPFAWIVVPPTIATAALKQILRMLCRHAIVVNLLSASWPSSLPMNLQPTLIAEVDSPSRRLLSTLRASQSHGVYPTHSSQVVDPFCAKVIFAREPIVDREAVGFPLEIVMAPAGEYVPPLDPVKAAKVAQEFQNRMLSYRLANFSKMARPTFDLGPVSTPVHELAHSFAGAIVGDDNLQAQILPYLTQTNEDIQNDSVALLNATIVEALVTRWSNVDFGVTDLTGDVNTLIVSRGNASQVSPETVGWKLKRLGFRTATISRGFRGLKMADARPTIAKLAPIYGLSVPEKGCVDSKMRCSSRRKIRRNS